MIVLSIILFIIYVFYFRSDGGSFLGAVQILKGFNSNTFNYLQRHTEKLMLHHKIPNFDVTQGKVTSINFFS